MVFSQFCLKLSLATMVLWTNPSSMHAANLSSTGTAETWWHERFTEKQAELHKQPVQLVFLGDSIFHSFEWDFHAPVWNHWYGGRAAVNLGFNGDTTADVIWRVRHGELDGLGLRLAVILIGTNDFAKSAADIAEGIRTLAQLVKDKAPASKILILGILPSGRPESDQRKGKEINARLATLYGRHDAVAHYQDVSCVFYHHGQFDADLFRERGASEGAYLLHPTPQGMNLIAALIEPAIVAALGDRSRTTSGDILGTDCSSGG